MNSKSLAILLSSVALVFGHGMVHEPPGRATAWRYRPGFPTDYNDNALNCGGTTRMHNNGDKCGICGDPYDEPTPRRYEYNGKNYRGHIVAKYHPGSVIQTKTQLTTHHKGYWEFRLCTDHTSNKQECFDKNLLELESGGTKYYPKNGSTMYTVNYKLPAGLTCKHCVLQWRYIAGNNWSGPQEEFRACSDVSILPILANDASDKYDEYDVSGVDLDVDNHLENWVSRF